jgi:hypothetical protein
MLEFYESHYPPHSDKIFRFNNKELVPGGYHEKKQTTLSQHRP